MAVVVDTDVLIDHLRGHRTFDVVWAPAAYSVITRFELFAGARGLRQVSELLSAMPQIPVDGAIAETAGTIRRLHGIPLADAMIAATALEHGAILLTRNLRDFRGIKGLKIEAPLTP